MTLQKLTPNFYMGGIMSVIMSLDQSSTATAYSIMQDGKLIDYGLIKP